KTFSGFLIDNVGDEDEEGEISANNHENSKSQKRTVSKSSNCSSVTTVESGSYEDDDGSIDGLDSDVKFKSGDGNEDTNQQVEIVKNYRTRSRTAAKI
ncbi:unnamed protein product, partial [Rotaria socialis]